MTDHARIRELLAAPPTFELSTAEQAEVDAHLAGCDACRAFAEGLRRDAAALQALPQTDAPDFVRRAVLGRARRRHSAGWYPAAAAAAVVVLVAPLALAVVLLGGLRIEGLRLIFGGAASGPSAVPGASEPGSERTGAPPQAQPPSIWRTASLRGPGASPISLAALAVNKKVGASVAVGVTCVSDHGPCTAVVARSVDGVTWNLVPRSPDLDVASVDDGSLLGMRDVVAGGPGFVAVGATGLGSSPFAAAWTSTDGLYWLRADDAGFREQSWINTIVALDDGTLVAGGGRLAGRSVHAAIWTSIDGRSWQLSPESPDLDVGAGPALQSREAPGIQDLVATTDLGLVAVGLACDPPDGPCRGRAWTSNDGTRWLAATEPDPFSGGQPWVAIASGGLVTAAGVAADSPAGWVTKDASRWLPSEFEGGQRGGLLLALTEVAGRQWGAGIGPAGGAGIWSSELGDTWRLSRSADLDGATVRALAPIGDVVVAAGERDGQGILWIGGGADRP